MTSRRHPRVPTANGCRRSSMPCSAVRCPPGDRRPVAATTRRGPQGFLDLLQALRPPISSSPPKPPPPPGQERAQARRPARTSRPPAPPVPARDARLIPTDYLLDACPSCGGHLSLTDAAEPIVAQRVEIAAVPLEIHEHRSHPGWCPCCQKTCYAPFPPSIERGGLAGPRLTTDHRLPQGRLPRLVFDHPQVRPRRHRVDHLALPTGQDRRQGEPGAGAAL